MLFPAPRYGAQALVRLIEAVDAKALLSPETPYPIEQEITETKKELRKVHIPTVDQLFAETVAKYPFTKTFETCKDEPLICLRKLMSCSYLTLKCYLVARGSYLF